MEQEKTHILKLEIYGTKYKFEFEVSHEIGIDLARQASKELEPLKWTRHSSCQGVIHHMDHYADIYNEGAVILTNKDHIENKNKNSYGLGLY